MDLKSFLQVVKTGTFTDKVPVIFLRGNQEYPLLFCSLLIEKLKKITSSRVESIDIQVCDSAKIAAKCATTFLGMHSYYWFYNISLADTTQKKILHNLFTSYQGPHCLIFFSLQSSILINNPESIVVDIPDTCTKELFLDLVLFTEDSITDSMNFFVQQLFSGTTKEIPLDAACRVMQYATLLGTHQAVFIKYWMPHFVSSDHSLFSLSQHLFAKNEKVFFKTWATMMVDYPDIFWVSFWSEQLWRATIYIQLMSSNNRIEAEKIAYRLPFSFKNKGWFSWKTSELVAAHSFLYTTDTILKNGGTMFNVELFYSKLFAGDFLRST